jgi:molybdopterin converting factor small subunit
MAVEVKVLYFGAAQEAAGRADEAFRAEDTASLRVRILTKYPAMARIPFRMALNKTILKEDSGLKESDIIAILPPFQGG